MFAPAAAAGRTHLRPLTRNRPRALTHRDTTTLTSNNKVFAISTGNGSQPDLPIISCVEDLAYLMHPHTPTNFASLAIKYSGVEGSTIVDSSSVARITSNLIQHYVHGNW